MAWWIPMLVSAAASLGAGALGGRGRTRPFDPGMTAEEARFIWNQLRDLYPQGQPGAGADLIPPELLESMGMEGWDMSGMIDRYFQGNILDRMMQLHGMHVPSATQQYMQPSGIGAALGGAGTAMMSYFMQPQYQYDMQSAQYQQFLDDWQRRLEGSATQQIDWNPYNNQSVLPYNQPGYRWFD